MDTSTLPVLSSITDIVGLAVNHAENVFDKQGCRPNDIFWRGVRRFDYRLVPKVWRDECPREPEEFWALNFLSDAPTLYRDCPRRNDYAGWLVLMQHYRVPTRLLDWTGSVLVATYFAVEKENDTDSALWALNPRGLSNKHFGIDRIYLPPLDDLYDDPNMVQPHIFLPPFGRPSCRTPPDVLAFKPFVTDTRMVVQHSYFTAHGNRTPLEDLEGVSDFLLKFRIPREAKAGIKKSLVTLRFRGSDLFPDLEHLAKRLIEP